MKHTNFDNEIEGRYHNEEELGIGFYLAVLVLGLGLVVLVFEFTGLTDNFISLWG